MNTKELIAKTSEAGWLKTLAEAYKLRHKIVIIDDAKLGIDPSNETLLQMGKKAQLSSREWTAILIALGVAATGAFALVMAIIDPEPFSKLAFTIGAGTLLLMGGSFGAIRVLTNTKPPHVRVTPLGIEIWWS
jgi:hypothetical protein